MKDLVMCSQASVLRLCLSYQMPNSEFMGNQQNPNSWLWHRQIFLYFLCIVVPRLLQKHMHDRPQTQKDNHKKEKIHS